jgi:hypothetical protein
MRFGLVERRPGQFVDPHVAELKNPRTAYYECRDCQVPMPPWFYVHDELWRTQFDHHHAGIVCWECFEDRIGRPLTREDLHPLTLCNAYWFRRFDRQVNPLARVLGTFEGPEWDELQGEVRKNRLSKIAGTFQGEAWDLLLEEIQNQRRLTAETE